MTIDWAFEGVSCTIEPIWSCPVAIILLEAKNARMPLPDDITSSRGDATTADYFGSSMVAFREL